VSWYPGETVITGIGQGYMLTTPTQLASMTSTLANRGVLKEPRLVAKIIDSNSVVDSTQEILPPQNQSKVKGIDKPQYEKVIKAMRDVVHSERGTARRISRQNMMKISLMIFIKTTHYLSVLLQ